MGVGLIITFVVTTLVIATLILGIYGYIDSLLLGATGGAIVVLIAFIPMNFAEMHAVNPVKTEVSSLKDTSETSGRFVLGSGTAQEVPYFYCVVEKDGFKSIDKAVIGASKIREGSYEKPYVLTYDVQYKSAIARFFYGKSTGLNTYEFYLPENTITTDYKIDME
ncbi:hypothetical protein [Bacillus safensis]|uniref:hypothetical protein n=1 Tax=Bacillus safensis TaxID=561879 RepID=UPI002E1CDB16|nr:hypothetical protein [Bacillus safensis]